MTIFVLDCGIGNVGAVCSMYRRLGVYVELIRRAKPLHANDRLVLPGVGAFEEGVRAIDRVGLRSFLLDVAASGVPLLGICLGMQLLCRGSEEGSALGLGLIPADVIRLNPDTGSERVLIPHMGWNVVETQRSHPLLASPEEGEQRFYFTHGYAVPAIGDHVLATTVHGAPFASAVGNDNVMGVQFHPEKSHRFGKALLQRFATMELAE